jgi:class 3 adenylate cyclase/tetratricopeptide (TPR) repeat protein
VAESVADGERRQLTVMFGDLVGYSGLAGRLDSEELREVVRAYQERAVRVIARYEGYVAQYLGDGLLVYFGYPAAHEDDAERAVRAGYEIPRAVEDLNRRLEWDHGVRLAVRVGIHTGPVVVGELGGGDRREILALGDATVIAARLQAVAEPNGVLISDATLRLVPGLFVTEDLGARALKGVAEPIHAYRVLQPSGVRSRFDEAGRLTPLVGREGEVGLLLDCWERAEEGEGQAVLVSGEAGVGKSRLLYVARERRVGAQHTWLECRCSPYSRNSAFQPMIELLQQGLGFTESDSEEEKLRRLEVGLELTGLSAPEMVPLLASLLSLPLSDRYGPLALSPELERRRTIEALVAWILALGERQPVVMLFEDLHWCDPSTLELLGLLLEQIPTARLLVLLAFRPEFEPPWPARSHVRPLALGRLRRRQVEQMIVGMTTDRTLPNPVVARIVERADGIPLYVEELTKMVLESGQLAEREGCYELTGERGELAIPATLQGSLMARLDRLSTAKQIAQVAAAIGREFPYRLLARVTEQDESTLHQSLARLVEAELLFQRGIPPNAVYTFKHALIQDTAYDSLLKRARQRLHGRIAEVLEKEFPERAAREPELVAHHYDRAGRAAEALPYYQCAGDEARARSSNAEAIAHLERGLELTGRLPEGAERSERELALQLSLGGATLEAHGFAREETRQAWERALSLCEAVGSPSQLAEALIGLSIFHQTRSELDAAIEFGEQLLALGRRTGDDNHLYAAHELLGNAQYWQGRFRECLAHYESALAIFEPKKHTAFILAGGVGPGLSSWSLWLLGYPERAAARAEEMVASARALVHPYGVAFALMVASVVYVWRREWETSERYAEECIELSERHGFPLWRGVSGVVHALGTTCNRGEDSLAEATEAAGGIAGTGQKAGVPLLLWDLARIHQKGGREADALGAVEAALSVSAEGKQPFWDAELLRLKGELVRSKDESEAELLFRRAVEVARRQEARSLELRAVLSLSGHLRARGQSADARGLLAPIHSWFSEGFDTQDLRDAKALLEEIS